MNKYFLLFLTFFILISSCKKEKQKEFICDDGSANYTFLGVGHELKYIFNDTFSTDDTMIISNISTDSNGTYKSTITLFPSNSITNIFYHACGKNLYTSTNGNIEQYSNYWISLDKNIGDTWTRKLSDNIYTYKLYDKNASITTPILNNTFTDCYKFTYQSNSIFYGADTIYFKPDIGIVYYNGLSSTYELASKNF